MITRTIVLACDPERAFELFTEQAGAWWPAGRRHTGDPASIIRMEATGRFFERAGTGTEVELGLVRLFEPPHRLLLDWYPGTGRANPTEVDVTFTAVGGGTRVTIQHRPGAAGVDLFARKADAYATSWDLVLTALAAGSLTLDIQ